MTGREAFPIAPPSLGEVLASPSAYAEAMIAGQTPCSFPPAFLPVTGSRRSGRARRGAVRRLAVRVAVAAVAGLSVMGCASGVRAAQRPVWDGRSPHVWTAEADPMCWRSIAGRHGWIQAGQHGPRFRAECQRDGSEYAWGIVTGGMR